MPYSCTLDGNCEADEYGVYQTLRQCRRHCRSVQYRDLIYIILAYSGSEHVLQLAPRDRQRILADWLGLHLDLDNTDRILTALYEQDYFILAEYAELDAYIAEQLGLAVDSAEFQRVLELLRQPYDEHGLNDEGERLDGLLLYPQLHPMLLNYYAQDPMYQDDLLYAISSVEPATTVTLDLLLTACQGRSDYTKSEMLEELRHGIPAEDQALRARVNALLATLPSIHDDGNYDEFLPPDVNDE